MQALCQNSIVIKMLQRSSVNNYVLEKRAAGLLGKFFLPRLI